MKSGSKEEDASGGQSGKPPHWRRLEHATTSVYVVHPTQFRTVVQQLTGAASSAPALSTHAAHRRHVGGGGNGGRNSAQAQQQQHGGGEEIGGECRGRTLGQMYQDCLAWANADDK